MPLYKCQTCTHEFRVDVLPLECDICGGKNLIALEKSSKSVKKTIISDAKKKQNNFSRSTAILLGMASSLVFFMGLKLGLDNNRLNLKIQNLQRERDELQAQLDQLRQTTIVRFCNQTRGETINLAVGYWDGNNGTKLRTKGWLTIYPSRCEEVDLGRSYTGNVYMYGQSGTRFWNSNLPDLSFCVHSLREFDFINANQMPCNEIGERKVQMKVFAVTPGITLWNLEE
ncbi:DUF1036 domain-containing protein [Planktothrix mougeotii]|uniref:DUF1036 domain-containing protein n=1 Tax=Planktothrix mougeotii LEGE 06226 TaxID=1828728 RepID=A0ABR9U7Y8_9CYAN|nr:DUF1036 domain-containing protein [Planktothrix mougeotii]MBE9142575.1 DUF1036 domain-containing protein [Planktothrix mougeotii LEGE 06226]